VGRKGRGETPLLAWSTLACVVWILISSARAGGDQWDNPRYRTIFLPWLALICAWGWDYARRMKNPWLWRILVVKVFSWPSSFPGI
jgi:hypothetical protein